MDSFDLIVKGGRVVTAAGLRDCDIGVRDGRIAALGALSGGRSEIDARGRLVAPGGVDVHAHIEQRSGMGLMNADSFETATRSAILGGTTTTVSFAPQMAGASLSDSIADYHARAERGAMTDYAFHLILNRVDAGALEELREVIAAGHRSIKVFTTYNIALADREILEVLTVAREAGALTCVHAESDALIGWTRDRLLAGGKVTPRFHAVARPRLAEIEAVGRMIAFAEFLGHPVMIFHVSTAEAVEMIANARARGVPILAETCPHYLLMNEDVLARDGAARWMCSPPQRTEEDSNALWRGVAEGVIDLVSSDHAPYRMDESGKLSAGPDASFDKIANGLPGLQTRMPVMFDAFRERGGLEAMVSACCTAPARLHGLAGKGEIAEGFDADLVIWDESREVTFGEDDLADNVGYNPWVGRSVKGWPEMVIRRGEIVAENGELRAAGGSGQWLAREDFWLDQADPAPEAQEALS